MKREVPALNYHHLSHFLAVATEGGITRAASKVGVSQSAISTQLSELERALGASLFLREGKKLILTEAGRLVMNYAQEIFRLGDELLSASRNPKVKEQALLRIGVRNAVPKTLILTLLQEARKISPCRIQLVDDRWENLLASLQSHELDLLISNSPPNPGERRLHSRKVRNFPVGIYGAHRFLALAPEFPQSLAGQPLIVPSQQTSLRHDFDFFLKRHQIDIELAFETDDTAIQKQLATLGLGLAVLPEKPAQALVKAGKLHRIGRVDGVFEGIWLITASRRIENPIASKLLSHFPAV